MSAPAEPPRVVLVTGGSGFLASQLATRLAHRESVQRVIAVDAVRPHRRSLGRSEFHQADLGDHALVTLLEQAEVDTVVHAGVHKGPQRPGYERSGARLDVLGTLQLLAACQHAPRVRRLVVVSSAAVYGAGPRDPALFGEDEPAHSVVSRGAADAVEVESCVRTFARRRTDVAVSVLRLADLVGPQVRGPLTEHLTMPVVPTPLGFDARLQMLHSDDALAALELATAVGVPGVFNVAADGVLTLSQAVRRAGRVPLPLPVPALAPVGRVLRGTRRVSFSAAQVALLTYGRVLDTSRVRGALGFRPRWSTADAYDSFLRAQGLRPLTDQPVVRTLTAGATTVGGLLR
ncbi:NAD-dependent epimerase/dehydratase family protein [Rhodococcus sp. X156]|uniref:NAD-dependent epimerase/dehydratase family protein n=1 Tax=Rhodococcus sp. X156 TaxID=2499145 RepID=UPI0019D1138F|nr:NAD-dependent epimerase/dehydratase family protein [Rhodococcus sp. X156]